ncbi:MAG TPA: ABC transporter substrate-binding protein [Clostridiales bacterium]|nr:ABC transporter substrate-binding protein [Clostridiales bacterium]HPV01381.1 ABC transporter substrate-binding protein [Clostridiales bacterium]
MMKEKKPFSLQLDVSDFLPADNEEKQSLVVMRESVSFWRDGLRRFKRNKIAMTSFVVIILIMIFAFIGPIDREWIVKNIGKAGQQPAGAFVPTGLSDADPTKEFREVGGDYYDPTGAAYEKNLEEAKKLLAEAGYPEGKGLPTLEYLYNEGTGHQAIAEAVQSMWKEIGVNVKLQSQDWNTFLNTRKNGEYDIARNGWLADYNDPISFLDMWTTDSGNNDAQWSNAKYDELIRRIKTSSDPEERYKLMHEAEDIIFEESMLCPIYYYVDIYVLNQKVQGFYSSPLGYKYFMYTWVE